MPDARGLSLGGLVFLPGLSAAPAKRSRVEDMEWRRSVWAMARHLRVKKPSLSARAADGPKQQVTELVFQRRLPAGRRVGDL